MPTTVTISECQPGPGECNFLGTTVKLRRYYNQDWTDCDGVFHAEGVVGSSTGFFDEQVGTLAANTITFSAFSATPTDNPQTGSNVQETWQLWDQSGSPRNIIFEGFIPSANPTITFGALQLLNQGQTLFASDAITRLDQWIQSYIDTVIGVLRFATSVIAGWVRLSVPAANVIDPIAVGDNDPRVPTATEAAALAGTNGTPSNTNRYVTNSDPRIVSAFSHSSHSGNYTVLTTDQSHGITLSSSVNATLTLPDPVAGGFSSRWIAFVQNNGPGIYSITPINSNLDGSTSPHLLYPGYGLIIQTDGTNWWTVGESDVGIPDNIPSVPSRRSLGAFPDQAAPGNDSRLQAVSNATPNSTPNVLALRDQNGGAAFAELDAMNVNVTLGYDFNGTKVVGAQGASVDDATNSSDVVTQFNLLLARVRAHGLIAAPSPPNAPSNLTATPISSSRIDLAWTDNSGGTASFKIERCSGVGCSGFTQVATTIAGVTTYQNTGLSQSTSYTYRVRAHSGGGDSAYSNTATAVTQSGPVAPDAVSGLAQWLKGGAVTGLVNGDPVVTWQKSGSVGSDGTGHNGPTYLTNVLNGKPVVKFDKSSSQWLSFTAIPNIRSVFMVVKDLNAGGLASSGQFPVLLGDLTTFDFAGGGNASVFDTNPSPNTSSFIIGGSIYYNGQQETQTNGLSPAQNIIRPTSFRLIEIITTGNVNASNLFNDRNAYFGNCELAEVAIYTSVVSDADRQGLQQYFVNEYGSQISAANVLRSNVVYVGDSQTGLSYTVRVTTCLTSVGCSSSVNGSLSYEWFGSVYATSGFTLQDMANFDAPVAAIETGSRINQVITIHGGTNDMYGDGSGGNVQTPQVAYARLIDRINAYKAAGYTKIVVVNCLPRSNPGTPVTFETSRQTFNSLVASGAAGNGYVVADLAANMTIGQAGNELNTTYYLDRVHLTDAGNNIAAPIVSAAIISIL